MITVDAKDAIADLDRIINGLDDAVADGLEDLAKLGAMEAKRLVPRKSGALEKSIDVERTGPKVSLVAGAEYAHWVEHGRGPVVAKGKALRFVINGETVFRRRVGPAAARPFMAPAGEYMQKSVSVVARSLRRLWR
ncbi:HK97 gp10 family phage protein [Polyangium sp. 15x6]|uniref:HK97 gp10 family phage protein n=1 Tax=Polyangium sp. 15x6 TaxID=3042687 RepID=UPI00249AE1F6|nr:HK97 gp10 family phage protein [Polyangium sp. 15x6]MDI3282118.1 HK97 gp10 family phage protein [Polyangium sp. 15x6]